MAELSWFVIDPRDVLREGPAVRTTGWRKSTGSYRAQVQA